MGKFFMRLGKSVVKRIIRNQKLLKFSGLDLEMQKYRVNLVTIKLGALVEQTLGEAVAQIQIVLRKANDNISALKK